MTLSLSLLKISVSPLLLDDIISSGDFMPTISTLVDVFHYFSEVSQKKRTIYGEIFDKVI